MKKIIPVLLLSVLLFMSGCTDNGYKSVEEVMQSSELKNKHIFYKHEVEDGIILLYENPIDGIDAGFVQKVGKRYELSIEGGVSSPSNETDITWNWINLISNENQHQFYIGIVNSPSITRLHIGSSKYIDKDVEIIELRDGTKLWFAMQDNSSVVQPGFILNGFDKDGKNVYHYEADQSIL